MLEQQRTLAVQESLNRQLQQMDMGKQNSLRRTVLKMVATGSYDAACDTLDSYIQYKRQYPDLIHRVSTHLNHCKELVHAIRSKRNFPGLSSLSMSKQKEILDYAVGHFEELKHTLKTIEAAVRDEAIKDYRSTTWVLRTLTYTVVAVVCVAFLLEFTSSLGASMWVVFDSLTESAYGVLSTKIPVL